MPLRHFGALSEETVHSGAIPNIPQVQQLPNPALCRLALATIPNQTAACTQVLKKKLTTLATINAKLNKPLSTSTPTLLPTHFLLNQNNVTLP